MATPIPAELRTPRLDRNRFDCPHCGTYCKQTKSPHYRRNEKGGFVEATDELDTGPRQFNPDETLIGSWLSTLCDTCGLHSTWREELLIYPRASTIVRASPDMPVEVVALYDEAREVMGVSRRAGAALARATLERLLKKLDATPPSRATLADRIDAIHGRVSSSLWNMLTVIRHVGNKALHGSDTPDDSVVLILDDTQTELVDLIFESINQLVDELVTKPNSSKRFLAMLPPSVLDPLKKHAN